MEMFFLIIHIGYSSVVLPDRYTKDQCNEAGLDSKQYYYCIKAPNLINDICQFHLEPYSKEGSSSGYVRKVCN